MHRGKDFNILKKEVTIYTKKLTRLNKSNNWRGIMEDKVMRQQQQGLSFLNPYSTNSAKTFIPDKYRNKTELKKLKRKNNFTKVIL